MNRIKRRLFFHYKPLYIFMIPIWIIGEKVNFTLLTFIDDAILYLTEPCTITATEVVMINKFDKIEICIQSI